jgi:TonB family protein
MFEILQSEGRLLWRLIVISVVGHVLVFLVFVGMNIARPPYRRIVPFRIMHLYSVTKPKTLATKVKKPQAAVKPKPKATPKPKRTPKPKPTPKKIVKKAKKTPTPAPRKPKKTPKPTPRRTPRPRSTPAPTPRRVVQPVVTPARTLPAPQPRPVTFEKIDLPDFYFQSALAKIESNFHIPKHLKNLPATTRVEFSVLSDGTITNIRIIKSSGNAQLDNFAVRTLQVTRTLGPLPDTVKRNYVKLSVTFDFSIIQ